ncbi:MAG: methionine gamma-lyase family protein [Firmicutes bacterium]|nr:methionine gamma-lyase family protein [Bacillota bacterium]CCX71862.1 aluminum resistance protein [Firmicutes bacterium CAG:555]
MKFNDMKPQVFALAQEAENEIRSQFERIDRIAQLNTLKVMQAFQDNKVSDSCFAGTTGYGYDDVGREVLDKVYAQIFCTDAALVRIGFVNGTHALSAALFAMLKPGDTLLSATGLPYDTLRNAIGIEGDCHGSLKFYGINYAQVDLKADGSPDIGAIKKAAADKSVTAVLIQRSRGYGNRPAFSAEQIGEIARAVKEVDPSINVMVDNCYGEFTGEHEPTEYGVDLMAGSLIKNPGGGLAPTGGYVVGKAELVEKAAMRLTTPGIGGECGATLGNNRLLFQGLFMAPHIVAQALKTATFCSAMMSKIGFETSPAPDEVRSDIIQMVTLKSADNMKKFCKGIQSGAPVDSYVTPEPWQMPGYNCPVIMAAGAFVQGSSIELSADGPMKEPYIAYMQGGITYESGKLGIMMAVNEMLE